MFSLKSVWAVDGRILFFMLALVPATALAQTRNGDPRSEGGRYVSPPIDNGAVEQFVRDETNRALNEEGNRLANYKAWLDAQFKEQKDKERSLRDRMDTWIQRANAWRCRNGHTLVTCACGDAVPVRPIYIDQANRDQREFRNNSAARSRLNDRKRSYDDQNRAYKAKLNASRSPDNRKSKRSPDEGLFIDESAPRRQ